MIDLRSDTVTKPTAAMREAMARAEVGDDVYGDDPTVLELEARTAELLGKEAAVYMPTGTMTNQVAIRAHTEAGDQILADASAHIFVAEGGAPAGLSGVLVRPLPGTHGIFTEKDVSRALAPSHRFSPKTIRAPMKLLCLENTHNGGGGTVWPLDALKRVTAVGRDHGLALHLDGARLWNASVASGVPEHDFAAPFDTVSVCFSKGLGAPIGSALAGSGELIERARRFKQMFGGGFRQAGVVAAAALHALAQHREGLAEDHEKAASFARGLAEMPGIEIDLESVQTNIVRFRLRSMSSAELVESCYSDGTHLLTGGRSGVRAVFHRDVAMSDVPKALKAVENALRVTKSSHLG